VKGKRQSKDREASYFIWTNGDSWQFYSFGLPYAPIYEVTLSEAHRDAGTIADRLRIVEKKGLSGDPEHFDRAIRDHWKKVALPSVLDVVREKHPREFIQFLRKGLPEELDIPDEELLEFVRTLKPHSVETDARTRRASQHNTAHSFPADWEHLIGADDPQYERAREKFGQRLNKALGLYLVSESYRKWPKSRTWRLVGLPDDPNSKKQAGGVIQLFNEWHFIERTDGGEKYGRVEDGVPYLKRLLNEPG
jgi:hypothetical protein